MTEIASRARFDFDRVLVLLTGRHIRRLDYVLATLVFSVLVHVTTVRNFELADTPIRILALLLAHAASVAFMLALSLPLKQARLKLSHRRLLLLAYPAAALIRGLTLNFTLVGFGFFSEDFAILRTFSSLATTVVGFVALAFLFGLKAEWSMESTRQQENQLQLRSLLSGAADRLEQHIKDDVVQIRETLSLKLKALVSKQPQEVAEGLKDIMDEVLRPKVAELLAVRQSRQVEEDKLASRKFKWGQLVSYLSLRYSVTPTVTTVALLATYVPFMIADEGWLHALGALLVGGPFIWGGLHVVSSTCRDSIDRLPEWPRLIAIIMTLALATLPYYPVFYLTFPALGDNVWFPILGTIGVVATGLLTGFSGAAHSQIALLKLQLESDAYRLKWQVAELKGRDWYLQQQFARKLHGPIQAELAAATIRIEQRISRGQIKQETVLEVHADLVAKLNTLLDTEPSSPELNAVLSEMSETWDGIATIDFEVSPESSQLLAKDPIAIETALEIVREACSNAIRHGKADQIRVDIIEANKDSVTVKIKDNGLLHDGSGRTGLGTKYLNDCTIENSRKASDSGSVLTAVIPVRA